jgi:methyl coenzyme M reductase subunit C
MVMVDGVGLAEQAYRQACTEGVVGETEREREEVRKLVMLHIQHLSRQIKQLLKTLSVFTILLFSTPPS